MFAKNKVSQSLVDAVSSIVNEAEKVPTTTGMKVYGSSYGNSQKARKDQLKSTLADVKGPSKSDIEKEKEVKEELKGDQHKIDANKNNKIDAHDFQLLRGKKKVKEDTFVDKLFNSLSESEEIRRAINEVMKRDASAGDWIHDFLHSDNPKFDGKSKAERKKMALAAYYSMRKRSRNESVEDLEMTKVSDEAEDTAARKSIKAKDTEKSQKIDNLDVKHGKPNAFGEEVEQVDEASTYKLGRADAETKEFPIKQNGEHVGRLEFHVSAGKLHHRAGNAKDVSYDKWHGNPNTESLVNAHVAKHEAEARKHFAKKLKEEVELNEVSKSEVDHHYDKWTTSDSAPDHHDAGDDPKIHKSALKYLRSTNEPKENHEKIAMHIANKFHGSGIDEAAPKKMDDVAKQSLTPAKKGVVGTVKSDFKNFKNFLAGKPETNEAVQTIDTLAGRSKKVPKEAKIDNAHSSAKVALKAEEVESLDEDNYLNKFLSSRGINPKFVSRNTKVAHAKSNEYKTWLGNHRGIDGYKMSEASEVPFDGPYTNTKKNVKDKSGAVHTPMSRAKDLAQQAMQRVKKDLK